jgi:hypothetical protein
VSNAAIKEPIAVRATTHGVDRLVASCSAIGLHSASVAGPRLE